MSMSKVLPFCRPKYQAPPTPPAPVGSGLVTALQTLQDIVQKLDKNAFTIIAFGYLEGRLQVEVLKHTFLMEEMLQSGDAEYFYLSPTEKHGEMFATASNQHRVRVIWKERVVS